MKLIHSVLLPFLASVALFAQGAGKSVLFDHTHHEEGGVSAEWVICSGYEPDPYPANPARETDWNGGLSALAFDLHNQGYKVQTLPASGGRITYGDSTNAQDLSHYSVFFIPECYTYFTAAEKTAIVRFVQNGGGLFLLGNHQGASRVSSSVPGSTDAFTVFNDLATNNGGSSFGLTWVVGHGPGDSSANTTSGAYSSLSDPVTDAIIRGLNGTLSLQDFHSYSYVKVDTSVNATAEGILSTEVSGDPASDYFIAACAFGNGRIVATGDSSPADDGTTTTSGKSLHNSYTLNSNRAFFLNAIQYLASASIPASQPPVVSITSPSGNTSITAGASVTFQATASDPAGGSLTYSWNFGDGNTSSSLGPIAHPFAAAGTYTATFTATNAQNLSSSATRVITVTSVPPSAPVITSQPTNQTVTAGQTATFTVTATGSGLNYQWMKNGAAISGATSAVYVAPATTTADSGSTFAVTVSNTAGSVSSNAATLTVNPSSTVPDLMVNGGFENGTASWTGTTGDIGTWSQEAAYEGTRNAWLCGNGSSATETLYQTVTIPSAITSATLSFYLHVDTAETTTTSAYDKLTVQVLNASGTVLKTLASYSNLNAASGYSLKTFDLSAYKGQTVRLSFKGTEDSSLQTSFVIDKVSLLVK